MSAAPSDESASATPPRAALRQCAGNVFMVNPAAFGFNAETAPSNALQRQGLSSAVTTSAAARQEVATLCQALRSEGVRVLLAEDEPASPKPDAVFPNNWVSFHEDGTLVLYPMLAPSRRQERRAALVDEVCANFNFTPRRRIDLTAHEDSGRFLEGTGSLVLDHPARLAYACRSPRTDESLVREWAHLMDYEPVLFDASDAQGRPYYHTNVLLWIGTRAALLCSAALPDADRERVCAQLRASGRELIEIDRAAVAVFAGNLLELASWDEALGDYAVLVMSASAHDALAGPALQRLAGSVDTVLAVPVPTIERVGGCSVRCM
ncbi:MAG: arginine deiminase-related protein, partial [Steroidobacteraceae bacterium]